MANLPKTKSQAQNLINAYWINQGYDDEAWTPLKIVQHEAKRALRNVVRIQDYGKQDKTSLQASRTLLDRVLPIQIKEEIDDHRTWLIEIRAEKPPALMSQAVQQDISQSSQSMDLDVIDIVDEKENV